MSSSVVTTPHILFAPTCTMWKRSRLTSTVPRMSLDRTTSASVRSICFATASSRLAPSKGRLRTALPVRQDVAPAYIPDQIPFPKCHKHLPTVFSQEEVARLIECAGPLMQRAMISSCRDVPAEAIPSASVPTSTSSASCTHGENLQHHPHVHCVVPAGGMSFDGNRWVATSSRFQLLA